MSVKFKQNDDDESDSSSAIFISDSEDERECLNVDDVIFIDNDEKKRAVKNKSVERIIFEDGSLVIETEIQEHVDQISENEAYKEVIVADDAQTQTCDEDTSTEAPNMASLAVTCTVLLNEPNIQVECAEKMVDTSFHTARSTTSSDEHDSLISCQTNNGANEDESQKNSDSTTSIPLNHRYEGKANTFHRNDNKNRNYTGNFMQRSRHFGKFRMQPYQYGTNLNFFHNSRYCNTFNYEVNRRVEQILGQYEHRLFHGLMQFMNFTMPHNYFPIFDNYYNRRI